MKKILALTIFIVFIPLISTAELPYFKEQATLYRNEGLELQERQDFNGAMAGYQKAILLDPNFVEAYNDLGIIYEAMGWTEEAKNIYLKAIEVNPNYPNSYSNLALLYESQKDYTHAILYWIKRAVLGGFSDPWAEAARKRLEDIARIYPEAYSQIGNQYRESLQRLGTSRSLSSEFQSPKITLFSEEAALNTQGRDPGTRALQYLARAKESFSKGDYVTALKEATTAEYLDSSNPEISAFIDKVRQALLR